MSQDPLWYKDAVFYELHVKAFQDSDGDGIGDFNVLIQRLATSDVIWLSPLPAPDDGFDLAAPTSELELTFTLRRWGRYGDVRFV